MIFCKSCGTKNNSSNKFCKNCGELLSGGKKTSSSESVLRKEVKRLEDELKKLKEEKKNEELEIKEKEKSKAKQEKRKAKKEKNILEENLEKIKEEIKEEVSTDIKEEVASEVTPAIKNEISKKVKSDLKKELATELKQDTLDEIKEEVTNEVSPAIKNEISKKVKNDLKKELATELKQDTLDEIKEEVSSKIVEEIKNEIKDEVSSEVSTEVKNEISKKVKNDIKKEITNEIKDDALTDIKDDVVDELKKEVRNEVKNELSQTMELIGLSEALKIKKKRSSSPFLLLLMIIAVAIGYFYLSYMFGPKHIVKDYLDALEDNDYALLYEYDESFNKKSFITEKMYMEQLKETIDKNGRLINYEIADYNYSSDGKSVSVRAIVTYLKDNKEIKSDLEVILYRSDEKKFFIFDTWYIKDNASLDIKIVKDYKIYVPSGSLVVYDEIELDEKYLENDSDSSIDVYRLNCVFEDDVYLRVVLPSGIEVVKEINPSEYYNEYRLVITDEDLEKSENDLDEVISNSLEDVVNNAFLRKKIDTVEWIDDIEKFESFSKKYDEYLEKIDSLDVMFSEFKIDNVLIEDIEFNYLYQYIVEVKLDYSWKSTFVDGEVSKNDFGFYTLYLSYEDGNYKLVDVNKLPNVFVN